MVKSQVISKGVVKTSLSGLAEFAIFSFIGFLSAGSFVGGELSPLNVALITALSLTNSLAVFAFSLVYYFFTARIGQALGLICAMIIIITIKFVFNGKFLKKKTNNVLCVTSGVLVFIFCIAQIFVYDLSDEYYTLSFSRGLLCSCLAYFTLNIIANYKKTGTFVLEGKNSISVGVMYIMFISIFASYDIFSFNIGIILGILFILISIRKFGYIGGVVCSILTSCGFLLVSTQLATSTILISVASLVAGLFAQFGIIQVIVSFVLTVFTGLVVSGIPSDSYVVLIEIAIATVLYIAIPSHFTNNLLLHIDEKKQGSELFSDNASKRLNFAATIIHDVNLSLNEVSQAMEKKQASYDIVTQVSDKVCGSCSNCFSCWDDNYSTINNAFLEIKKKLEHNKAVTVDDFPEDLNHCIDKNCLEKVFNQLYNDSIHHERISQRLSEMRLMLSDQFYAMEEMTRSFAEHFSIYIQSDSIASEKLSRYFEKKGIADVAACVYINKHGLRSAEIYYTNNMKFDCKELCIDISLLLETDFEYPQIVTINGLTRVEMWEKPQYSVDIGASQIPGSNGEMTGDSYEIFLDSQAQAFIVLSDGMGSGKRAQLDSLLTSSLISRLLRAGMGYYSSIRLINSSMRVKAWDESFATVDICRINLYDGTLNLIKAGASATYIYRNGKIKTLVAKSMPVGILQNIKPAELEFRLKLDDIIISASDGLSEDKLETIRKCIQTNRNLESKEISKCVINELNSNAGDSRTDDITVIITKFGVKV